MKDIFCHYEDKYIDTWSNMKKYFFNDISSVIKQWVNLRLSGLFFQEFYSPHNLPSSINVEWEYDKDNDSYYAEVTTLPGLYTTSNSSKEIIRSINSMIYKYFDVPDYIAAKEMERGLRYNPSVTQIEKIVKQGGSVRTDLSLLQLA